VLHRLPRTRIGPTKGIWSSIQLAGEKTWVHARYRGEVEGADAGL
jgi:hypothetical protein